jgi:hypothetical protein
MLGRLKLYILGLAALIVGAVLVLDFSAKQSWTPLEAKVLSVDVECEMEATERGILTKTTSKAVIECDQVQRFKALYPDKTWRMHTKYIGLLQYGAGRQTASLLLSAKNGKPPAAGDLITVVQNPADPSEITHASRRGTSNLLLGGGIGAFGLLLIALPHLRRRPKLATEFETARFSYAEAPAARPAPVVRPAPPASSNGRRTTFGRRGT